MTITGLMKYTYNTVHVTCVETDNKLISLFSRWLISKLADNC